MRRKVEILSPAGSYESLKAAVAAGADAVYIGGSHFGARAFADNLAEEQLLEAIDYVHLHGRQIYLTVNTLLKEQEIQQQLYDYLLPYYKQGLDAVIVQDIGVLKFVREHFPDLPVHASTQMTITNVEGAKFLESLGVERVVTAREMTLPEIAEIAKNTKLEIESFVHGALCYCYSGQCLYSSLIGGRSGNRGQCAQPCRLPYQVNGKTSYVMSLKDMCALEYIPDLIEAGIFSFKIEGRMKKPEYVAAVTSIYRKYVDLYLEKGRAGFHVAKEDQQMLADLYNRGGFHGGYYRMKNGKEMLSLTRPNHAGVPALRVTKNQGKELRGKALTDLHGGDVLELPDGENYTIGKTVKAGESVALTVRAKKTVPTGSILNRTRNESLLKELKEQIVERKVKEKINGKLILSSGKRATLELFYGNICVRTEGEEVQEALNQPMDEKRLEKQMRKTGNTEFEFETLTIEIEGKVFLTMQSLNELRRQAVKELEEEILAQKRREKPSSDQEFVKLSQRADEAAEEVERGRAEGLYVYVEKKEQLEAVLAAEAVTRIYVDCNMLDRPWEKGKLSAIGQQAKQKRVEIFFAMPHIFRKETVARYEDFFEEFPLDGVLVRNYESYEFVKERAPFLPIVLDSNMYAFNHYAKDFWKEHEVQGLTAPLELNYKELQMLGIRDMELIVYGYLQMMISAQCIRKTTEGCAKKTGFLKMTDRKNKELTVKNCCDYCYNVIYNAEPMSLLDQKQEIAALSPKALRLHFTLENREETEEILQCFIDSFVKGMETDLPSGTFTRGHFKRGIK